MPILKCLSSHVRSVSCRHKERKRTCRKSKLQMGVVWLCGELMLGCVGLSPGLRPFKVCNSFGEKIIQNILNFSFNTQSSLLWPASHNGSCQPLFVSILLYFKSHKLCFKNIVGKDIWQGCHCELRPKKDCGLDV